MELRMEIDKEIMEELKKSLKVKKNVDVVNNALTLLNWAVDELKEGRIILSSDSKGGDLRRLVMPDLENAKIGSKSNQPVK
ncbi:MAG: hypothetical protein MI922_13095 [Bacteroidales bacterium]|nr:hypothetical protein [Bacteroidales bacterium]